MTWLIQTLWCAMELMALVSFLIVGYVIVRLFLDQKNDGNMPAHWDFTEKKQEEMRKGKEWDKAKEKLVKDILRDYVVDALAEPEEFGGLATRYTLDSSVDKKQEEQNEH